MLHPDQAAQVSNQIEAYEKLSGGPHQAEISLGNLVFSLEIAPYVATPKIMNSGLQVVQFLVERPAYVQNKVVVDMGTGSGIIGIAAALLGAQKVLMPEIDPIAVSCATANIQRNKVGDRCEAFVSNLFDTVPEDLRADTHIFNHPFFSDEPREDKEWTRMMLGGEFLIQRYLQEVRHFAMPSADYIFPWLPLAGSRVGDPDNNPARYASKFGFEVEEQVLCSPTKMGIQQSNFIIYILSHP